MCSIAFLSNSEINPTCDYFRTEPNGTSLRRKQLIVKSLFILSKKKNDILKVAANDNRDSFTNIAFKNHMPSYLNQARNTNTFKYLQLKEVPFRTEPFIVSVVAAFFATANECYITVVGAL